MHCALPLITKKAKKPTSNQNKYNNPYDVHYFAPCVSCNFFTAMPMAVNSSMLSLSLYFS